MAMDWITSVEDLLRMQQRQPPSHPGASSAPGTGTSAGTTTSTATTASSSTATTNAKAASNSALPWYNAHGWCLKTLVGNGQCNQLLMVL
ncbi:hypothetical protein SI65_06603 [Aspergillus cristatus]|uniref:Uncharacterized protein n=1 Tax=Aspergillus cristatus TaxID=573508 RepID=A0A1E3BA34_ASPCR|nr:hypothetical protein SI65_06603 [Aspergillus cristatus]